MLRTDCGGCRHFESSPSQAAAASGGVVEWWGGGVMGWWGRRDLGSWILER